MPMSSISWILAQRAWQERRSRLTRLAGKTPVPELNDIAANGGPASTPSLAAMLKAIGEILAIRQLLDHPNRPEFVGNMDDRATYRPPGSEVPAKA
jgi:hypothetical protein